ncbi:MAG: hypothetical protein JWR80_8019 [Bradyrhizobium sp.]|nr:hypothetical protein [Bradyrhizobium sp.]
MSRNPARHTFTIQPADDASRRAVAIPYDALANPDNDGLIGAALTLWPQGAAWGTPDGAAMEPGSLLARLTRVLLDPFIWLYRRAYLLAREATVSGVNELLADWEAEYGLPDDCEIDDQSIAERLRSLSAKVMSARLITPGEFVRLGRSYGFEIAIDEPDMFECGFSECGGAHETGSAYEEVYFIVRVRDLQVTYFLCGEGELGDDPLFEFGASQKLLCLIRQAAPAWTIPVLGDWRYDGEAGETSDPFVFGGSGMQITYGNKPLEATENEV